MRDDADVQLADRLRDPYNVVGIIYPTGSIYLTNKTGMTNVPGNVTQGVLKDISSSTQRLFPDEGRATIGTLTFSAVDLDSDITTDLRSQFTTYGSPRTREVRVFSGNSSDFNNLTRVETYVVDDVVEFSQREYKFKCSDRTREAKVSIFDRATTRLNATLTEAATTMTVIDTTGFDTMTHTAAFTDAPSATVGYLLVKKTGEIIRYTGKTATTFTGLTRGVFNTQATEVVIDGATAASKRPEIIEFIYLEMPAPHLLYAILTGVIKGTANTLPSTWHMGIAEADIDGDSFDDIGADLYDPADATIGMLLRFTHLDKVDGKKFYEEQINFPSGTFLRSKLDGTLQLRRVTALISTASPLATYAEGDVISHGAMKHNLRRVINRLLINWNWNGERYTRANLFINSTSITEHGPAPVREISLKGLHVSRHSLNTLRRIFDSVVDRYGAPPIEIPVRLSRAHNNVEIGDVVQLDLDRLPDYTDTGSLNRPFEVQGRSINWRSGRVDVSLFGSTSRIVPDTGTGTGDVLDDTEYTGIGATELSTVLTISGGAVTANGTLTGGSDLRTSVFYYDGDLTINSGVTVTITDNVQLRVAGTLTVNGKIDGAGQGIAGVVDPNTVGQAPLDPPTVSQPNFGSSISGGSFKQTDSNHWTWRGYSAEGTFSTAPRLDLAVEDGELVGIPADIRGTRGVYGFPIHGQSGSIFVTRAKGGTGGAGGAGLFLVCRGLAFGASGEIDTSGGDGITGTTATPFGRTLYSGSGAGGMPGMIYIILDGDDITYPDTSKLTATSGNSPFPGTPATSPGHGGVVTDWPGEPATVPAQLRGTSDVDMWEAAHLVQYVPTDDELGESDDEVVPIPQNLAATVDGVTVQLNWDPLPEDLYDVIEVWEATTNDRSGAVLAASVLGSTWNRSSDTSITRYYWVRAVKQGVGISGWEPDGATAGVSATFGGAAGPPGDDGVSTFFASVFIRSATTPATPTADDGQYNFTTTVLTPPTGWSTTVPAYDGNPLWESNGMFDIVGQTGIDTTVTWSAPSKVAEDGVDGADGADGSAGDDSRTVNLTAGQMAFLYLTDDTLDPAENANTTVTATALNTLATPYYEFFLNDVSQQDSTSNTWTYTPQASYTNMPDKVEVHITEGGTGGTIYARDQITMNGLKPGVDAPLVTQSNEAHTVPVVSGSPDYTGSANTIRVFIGTTALSVDTSAPYAAGSFRVSAAVGTNITVGSQTNNANDVAFGDITAMTADTGQIEYTIVVQNNEGLETTITRVQSFSRSSDGADGSDGVDSRTVNLTAGQNAFDYLSDNTLDPAENANTTVTATALNTVGTPYYEFLEDDVSAQNTTSNTYTFTPEADWSNMPDKIEVRLREGSGVGQIYASDQLTIYGVKPGVDAPLITQSNEAHTVPVVSGTPDYTGSGNVIEVYLGDTQVPVDAVGPPYDTPSFRVTAAVGSNITVGSQSNNANDVTFGAITNMTADTGSITYTIVVKNNEGNETSITRVQSFSRSSDGADGSDGIDSRTVNLTAGQFGWDYLSDNTLDPAENANTSVVATALNTVGTPYYEFIVDDVSQQNTTSNSYTYTPQASWANMPDKIEVHLREGGTGGTVYARDQITMQGIKPGVDAPLITQSNEAHVVPVTNTTVHDYTGSGNVIKVYLGTTELSVDALGPPYDNGSFRVTAAVGSNLTVGTQTDNANDVTFGNISNMTADTASITYTIVVKNNEGIEQTVTRVQSFGRSVEGDDGLPGADGSDGADGADGAAGANALGILINGDFETGDNTGWGGATQGTVQTGAAHGGTYGVRVNNSGNPNHITDKYAAPPLGDRVYVSAWARRSESPVPAGNQDLAVRFYDSSEVQLSYNSVAVADETVSGWQFIFGSIVTPNNAAFFAVDVGEGAGASGYFDWDDVSATYIGQDGIPGGQYLNADPFFDNIGKWWFADVDQTNVLETENPGVWSQTTDTTAVEGTTVLENDRNAADWLFSEKIPCDEDKTYIVEVAGKQEGSGDLNYLLVAFYDNTGNDMLASGDATTGWTSKGSWHYWRKANEAFSTSAYEKHAITFGKGGEATIPTGAKFMAIGALLQENGTDGGYIRLNYLRVRQYDVNLSQIPDFGAGYIGGNDDAEFIPDYWEGAVNTGEVTVRGSVFDHPDGTRRSLDAPFDDGVAGPWESRSGEFYIMWTDTVPWTRFGGTEDVNFYHENYVFVQYRDETDGWVAIDNTGNTYSFTPAATDAIVAAGVSWATGGGVDELVKLTGTISNPEVQDRNYVFKETFDNYNDQTDFERSWTPTANSTVATFPASGLFGGKVLQSAPSPATQNNHRYERTLVEFDPNALYKVSVRFRKTVDETPTNGDGFYAGVHCIAADQTTFVSKTGTNSTEGHYLVFEAYDATVAEGWVERSVYVKGTDASNGEDYRASAETPLNPLVLHEDARYMQPYLLFNTGSGSKNAVHQVDYFLIEKVESEEFTAGVGLVDDPSFTRPIESTWADKSSLGTSAATIVTGEYGNALRLNTSITASTYAEAENIRGFESVGRETFWVNMRMRWTAGMSSSGLISVGLRAYNEDGTVIGVDSTGLGNTNIYDRADLYPTQSTWYDIRVPVTIDFTPTSDSLYCQAFVRLTGNNIRVHTIEIDSFVLTRSAPTYGGKGKPGLVPPHGNVNDYQDEAILSADGEWKIAVFTGHVDSAATAETVPTGWSVTDDATTGEYTVTHNLGLVDTSDLSISAAMAVQSNNSRGIWVKSYSANSFTLEVATYGGTGVDDEFFFTCVLQINAGTF